MIWKWRVTSLTMSEKHVICTLLLSLASSAAATTRPHNTVSVTSIIGGVSDNTGSGIARRIVLKTGLNVILACNIPKDSLMLEANAEKKLVEKLIGLGYTRPKAS